MTNKNYNPDETLHRINEDLILRNVLAGYDSRILAHYIADFVSGQLPPMWVLNEVENLIKDLKSEK